MFSVLKYTNAQIKFCLNFRISRPELEAPNKFIFEQVCVTVEVTSLPPGYNGGTIQRLVDLPPLSKPSMPFLFPAQLVGKSRKFMRT